MTKELFVSSKKSQLFVKMGAGKLIYHFQLELSRVLTNQRAFKSSVYMCMNLDESTNY